MNRSAIDIVQALARLSALTIFELRSEWRRLHRMPAPMRLSRDLLMRGITYKLQERPLGDMGKKHHVFALAFTRRAVFLSEITTVAAFERFAKARDRKFGFLRVDE